MQKITRPIVVANWKMNLSFNQTETLCADYYQHYIHLQTQTDATIILCPSFVSLPTTVQRFKGSAISIGAQNCAAYPAGAYTGQVSALSLAQIGCSYCIVGHSECRTLNNETNIDVAHKVEQLILNNIIPIVCIGQTAQEQAEKKTQAILSEQLTAVVEVLGRVPARSIIIAYEPMWAIGTGIVPTAHELTELFSWLDDYCKQHLGATNYSLLYGGSVDEKKSAAIGTIAHVDGFLVGSASLDFQKFKKIVSL